ncbi:MAG: photosystem II reaction center protein Psb28 [Leptolyngbya sp. SIO1D8]|nr:photosystem II reaction center protein Psb28 [Leptolyngbya sp. SIO1D8]
MAKLIPCIQIIRNIPEKLSSVSLGRDSLTENYVAVLRFQTIASLAHFLCFKRQSANALYLIDDEGEISIASSDIKMLYGGPEEKDPKRIECKLEIEQEDLWERFMRFIYRYAESNGLTYEETESAELFNSEKS